jgi:hypothetical protein
MAYVWNICLSFVDYKITQPLKFHLLARFLFFMPKNAVEKIEVNPKLLKQFLEESAEVVRELNEDLIHEFDPIIYHRNKIMIAQIELLIVYLN